jgi:hypothetical protein
MFFSSHARNFEGSIVGPGGVEAIQEFWETAQQQDWGRPHKHLDNLDRLFPFVIHTDGAQIGGNDFEADFWMWSSLSSRGNSFLTIFYMVMVPTLLMVDKKIMEQVRNAQNRINPGV